MNGTRFILVMAMLQLLAVSTGVFSTMLTDQAKDDLSKYVGPEIESARNLAPSMCKYNLRNLAHKVLNGRNNYELIRDRRRKNYETGNGPRVFQNNRLPEELANKTCDLPKKNLALNFFVSMPKNAKRFVAGCIAHYGSHETESPSIAIYDCNGNMIKCGEYGYSFKLPQKTNILIVMTPDTPNKPDAFMFYFSRRKQHRFYCEMYPF